MKDILIFGLDDHLLESRQWLLEAQGYHVLTVRRVEDLPTEEVPVALFILCHTVPRPASAQILEIASARWPAASKLSLIALGSVLPPQRSAECFHTIDGPARLIQLVHQLVPSATIPTSYAVIPVSNSSISSK